ncbi:hypothetical protein ACFY4C_30600 [Actinomadura viridis]|uniref:hypothetical protein n=1 Tax=Actinomadura viridis TaxID=58110 RepID=UPI00368C25A9
MKHRTTFIAGAALGYVLGTKAGRERYDQMRRASRRLAENPNFQEAAGAIRAKGEELAGAARERAPEQLRERIPGLHRETPPEYEDPRREATHP